jgi:cellulose synthase/poly-beta-1,6-N-acetylglucosamine synthase-like glycosyltransferase
MVAHRRMTTLFYLSLFMWLYAYAGYPLALLLARTLSGSRRVPHQACTPRVTVVVPVHNGAHSVAQKARDLLDLDYPRHLLEVVVVSDGSDDGTGEVVRREAELDPRVHLVAVADQQGKENAINRGVAVATGDIIVVSDLGVQPRRDALRLLVEPFGDERVGATTGVDSPIGSGGSAITGIAGLYTRYEIAVRRLEAAVGNIVVVNGCFFAVRRSLVPHLVPHQTADLAVPLQVIRRGFRVVLVPEAAAAVPTSRSVAGEFHRRVRTFNRGITTFLAATDLLNPFRHGWVAVQLVSHKLVRWLVPLWLAGLALSSAALATRSQWFALILLVQVLLYSAAILGLSGRTSRGFERLVSVPSFYLLSNASIVIAWTQVLRGQKAGTWKPTER